MARNRLPEEFISARPSPTEHAVADKHKVGSSLFCDALIVTGMGILQWLTALWRAVGGNAGNGFPSISSDRITLNSVWRRLWNGVVISVFLRTAPLSYPGMCPAADIFPYISH